MILLKENKELLEDRLSNGLMALPFYRTAILHKLNSSVGAPSLSGGKKILRSFSFLKYPSRLKFPRSKIVIFSTTVLNIKKGDYYFNQLHGFYKNVFEKETTVIEECDSYGNWRVPNEDPDICYSHTCLICICRIYAVIMSKIMGLKRVSITNIRNNYSLISDTKMAYDNYLGASVYWFYKRIFSRRKNLKLLIINCASYGGYFAAITKAAHECGIIVAETQHGMINDIHYVYSVEDFVYSSQEYKQYLPDYLLTFGQFWNEHSRINVQKVIVGNPYMEYYKNNYSATKGVSRDRKKVLFISQPDVKDVFLDYVRQLRSFKQYQVVFRLHPYDIITNEEESELLSNGIIISNSKTSLYDDILDSDVVIGGSSTCLYEAMGLGRPILVFSNKNTVIMYRDNQELLFVDFEDLRRKLENKETHRSVRSDYYFANQFVDNYKKFLDTLWK